MSRLRSIAFVGLALLGAPLSVSALPLEIRSVTLTPRGDAVCFETVFDRAPDFVTVDEYGRKHDAFQFTLTHDIDNPYLFRDVWIDGVDIGHGAVPVYPMQLDGRFGPVSAEVPYLLSQVASGHLMTFTVPYAALIGVTPILGGDPAKFHWFLDTFQYGDSPNPANHAQGAVGVPEPGIMLQMGVGAAVWFLARRRRRS